MRAPASGFSTTSRSGRPTSTPAGTYTNAPPLQVAEFSAMKRSRRSSTLPRWRSTSSPCVSTASSSDESTTPAARASSSRRTCTTSPPRCTSSPAVSRSPSTVSARAAASARRLTRREGIEVDAAQRGVAPVLVLERRQGRAFERRACLAAALFEPCGHQPTEPSICSWIRRFISTAYSSGSSLVIGSTKPATIIAEASASESPRLRR